MKTTIDLLFGRLPRIERCEAALDAYDHVVMVAPVWASKLASPLGSFIARERHQLPNTRSSRWRLRAPGAGRKLDDGAVATGGTATSRLLRAHRVGARRSRVPAEDRRRHPLSHARRRARAIDRPSIISDRGRLPHQALGRAGRRTRAPEVAGLRDGEISAL